jgi:hypothetical protein
MASPSLAVSDLLKLSIIQNTAPATGAKSTIFVHGGLASYLIESPDQRFAGRVEILADYLEFIDYEIYLFDGRSLPHPFVVVLKSINRNLRQEYILDF